MKKKNKILPTILITYVSERVKYLKRLIDYYKDYDGDIIFAGPKFDVNFKIPNNFNFYFTDEVDLYEKIISCEDRINSDLVVWSAEDDFVCKRFLNKAALKLTNQNIVAVDGYALKFSEKKLKLINDYYFWHHLRNLFSLGNMRGASIEERISNMGDMFTGQPVHSVCRKDAFFEAWTLASKKPLKQLKWSDKIVTFGLLINGEIAYFPVLAHFRSIGLDLKSEKFHPKIFKKSFNQIFESKEALEILVNYLIKKFNFEENKAQMLVDSYLNNITRYYLNNQYDYKNSNFFSKFFKKLIIKFLIPSKIFNFGFFPENYILTRNEINEIFSIIKKNKK